MSASSKQTLWSRLTGAGKPGRIAPDLAFCVVGDVHGRLDLLESLLSRLPRDYPVFLVGDVVDRGEQSAQVLRYLMERPEITCLKGNHEAMMVEFLNYPVAKGPRWLNNGGLQTLSSFGLSGMSGLADTRDEDMLRRIRDDLMQHLGETGKTWLSDLPPVRWSGNVVIAHAGANPDLPMDDHDEMTFVWGHRDFLRKPRHDGFWVVHGHTIVGDPTIDGGRIAIDTGAYATGRLTAAIFTPGEAVRFVTT